MPEGRLLASYRPTARQLLGRMILLGVGVGAVAVALFGLVTLWGIRSPLVYLAFVPLGATVAFAAASELVRHGGVDATEHGLIRVTYRSSAARFVPWRQVLDIRTERRGWRTVVVVPQVSGVQWRLAAPYDGRWLSHDPDFEPKLFYLRNLWETYRTRAPYPPRPDPVDEPGPRAP